MCHATLIVNLQRKLNGVIDGRVNFGNALSISWLVFLGLRFIFIVFLGLAYPGINSRNEQGSLVFICSKLSQKVLR